MTEPILTLEINDKYRPGHPASIRARGGRSAVRMPTPQRARRPRYENRSSLNSAIFNRDNWNASFAALFLTWR